MTRPRMKSLEKEAESIKILGKELHKTTLFFIAQVVAYWVLILGFLIFVYVWYAGR